MAEPDAPSPDPQSVHPPKPAPPADPILQMLVNIVDKTTAAIRKEDGGSNVPRTGGASMGITLVVRGAVISGTLISGQEYLTKVGGDIKQGMASEGSEWMLDLLGGTFEKVAAQLYDAPGDEGGDVTDGLPSFIHLKDARIFTPGQDPFPQAGMWWRGRLGQVDGFTVGMLLAT